MPIIRDVYFNYTKIAHPALKKEKDAVEGKPWVNRECISDILITEKTYKALRKKYGNVKAVQNVKVHTAEEYEQRFKVAVPYESDDDEYYTIKLRKPCDYKDGNKAPYTEVYGAVGKTKDRNGNAVNADVEIGNGSMGDVMFRERTWKGKNPGMCLDLMAVSIKDLVVYESKGVNADEFGFEPDESDEFSNGKEEFGDEPEGGSTSGSEKAAEPTTDDDW